MSPLPDVQQLCQITRFPRSGTLVSIIPEFQFLECGIFSPLLELYPIGSQADVFYNPRKPKMAYVQRFARPQKILYTIILLLGLTFLAAALFIFFGPTITMH